MSESSKERLETDLYSEECQRRYECPPGTALSQDLPTNPEPLTWRGTSIPTTATHPKFHKNPEEQNAESSGIIKLQVY